MNDGISLIYLILTLRWICKYP